MIEFCKFETFLSAVKKFTKEDLVESILKLQKEGIDIASIDDLFINDKDLLFTILPDGTLKRVNLYIAEQIIPTYEYELSPKYKYHIFKCKTLVDMFTHNRHFRYKINTRDDGTFYYRYVNNRGRVIKEVENERLPICKNCLKKYFKLIGKKYDYTEAENYVNNFNLKEIDEKFSSFFDQEDINDIELATPFFKPNVYPTNWDEIAKKLKEKKSYICENCGFYPKNSYEKKFIHVHHINGDKTNNQEDNLKVLCIKCHSEVDKFHSRLKDTQDYKEFLKLIHKEL